MNTCYETMLSRIKKDGFMVYYGHKIPMSRFMRDVEAFCCGIKKLGLNKGDVVTLYLPTCPQSVVAFYACSKLGLIASFVHPMTPVDELLDYVKKTESKVLLFYDVLVRDERKLSEFKVELVRCSIADYVILRKPAYSLYSKAIGKRLKGIRSYKNLVAGISETLVAGDGGDVRSEEHTSELQSR